MQSWLGLRTRRLISSRTVIYPVVYLLSSTSFWILRNSLSKNHYTAIKFVLFPAERERERERESGQYFVEIVEKENDNL